MYLKIVSVFVVFAEIGVLGYLPYLFPNIGQSKRAMSIVGCFAGGLFLALALLHILPEANQEITHALAKEGSHLSHLHKAEEQRQMQWGSLIAMATFVGVLTIESLVSKHLQQRQQIERKKNDQMYEAGHEHTHELHTHHHISSAASSVILTQLALSIHAFIECMALGSQSTSKATLTLLIGIGCHKWAQGLTLGFEYKRANFSPKMALNFCLFHACLNAGAVVIGWLFSQSSEFIAGVLGAISAGTFLYVSTIQKIQEQFSTSQRLGQKILAMSVGIGFVCLII